MTAKCKSLLLDANVVIYSFELGIWDLVTQRCDLHIAETIVRQEALFYRDSKSEEHTIDLSADPRITVFSVPPSDLHIFQNQFDLSYLERLDAGEAESLAHLLTLDEEFMICSSDSIVFRILGNLQRGFQGVSVEELLDQIGLGRAVDKQYTRSFRESWTKRGLAEGLGGMGIKR